MLIKKYQTLVVRARLKRVSTEVTKVTAKLRTKELRSASDRHLPNVTLPGGRQVTTNEGIYEGFRSYFQELFTKESGMSSAQFETYSTDFPRFDTDETAGCEGVPLRWNLESAETCRPR